MAKGKHKVHSLTGRITSELMNLAGRSVRRNRGAAGVDKVSIEMFETNLDANLNRLMRELKTGEYQPLPARRVYIPKDARKTKFRPLGIPAVRDRVAQEVLRRLLSPIFEAKFHDHSFAFRPERTCHQPVEKVLELGQQGYRYVLDADISGFFDNLSHEAIMLQLADEVADGNILRLVEKFLRAGVMEGGRFQRTRVGTPQGGVHTPQTIVQTLEEHLTGSFLVGGFGRGMERVGIRPNLQQPYGLSNTLRGFVMEDTTRAASRISTHNKELVLRQFLPTRIERLLLTRLFDLTTGSRLIDERGGAPSVPLNGSRTRAGRKVA